MVGRAALGGASCRRAATRTVTRERESDTPAARGFFTDLNTTCVVTRVRPRPSFGVAWSRFVSFLPPPVGAPQLALAYLTAATHGLDEDAARLSEAATAAGLELPALPDPATARLLQPPTPIMRADNWPLLALPKVWIDLSCDGTFHHMRTFRLPTTRDGTVTSARLLPKVDLATTFSHQDHLVFGTAQM